MKALIFSDLHCHQHKNSQSRLEDCIEALEWVFKTAQSKSIDLIIFCGDLFHDRAKIDILTYQRVFETFQKYLSDTTGPEVYLLLGNHDLFYFESKEVSSVYPLSSLKKINIISKPSVVNIREYNVGFMPYTHDPISDLKLVPIREMKKGKNKYNVLFGHLAVHGALFNLVYGTKADVQIEGDAGMTVVTPDIFDSFDRVFLGHYHAAQELTSKVEYVGSPLQLSFGEMEQKKHIVIYDFESDTKEYIENTFSHKHLRFNSIKEAAKAAEKGGLKGEFVEIFDENTNSSDALELKQTLIENKVGTFSIRQLPKSKVNEAIDVQNAKSILSSTDQMLTNYIGSIKDLKLDKNVLLTIGKKICEKKVD